MSDGDATVAPGRVVRFFGAPAGAQAAPGHILDVSTRLNVSGARRLAVLGYAARFAPQSETGER